MGRPFILKFDQTPVNEFYVCRKCQTHIALEQEHTFDVADDNELKGPIFGDAINWYSLEEVPTRTVGDSTVAEIYCNNCSYPLGFQFIEILEDLANLVEENYFLLHWSKLLKWDGYQIVDPVEVEDDEPNPVEVEDPNPVEVEDDEVGPNPVEVEDDRDDDNN